MRRNRVRVRRSVSSATGVVESVILPGSRNDCQDVDEVGTEPFSDADSDLFGLDWGDDPSATINSVTERNVRTRDGNSLIPVRLTTCFPSQYVPSPGGDFQVAERSWF